MNDELRLARLASELRRSFDAGFARANALETPSEVDLLQLRVRDQLYAVRLSEVAAVLVDRELVKAPSRDSALCGLTTLRGVVVGVYDLALLLGHPRLDDTRWLLQLKSRAPLALAFSRVERHLRLPTESITWATSAGDGSAELLPGSVRTDAGPVPLLDLGAVFERVTSSRRKEERR